MFNEWLSLIEKPKPPHHCVGITDKGNWYVTNVGGNVEAWHEGFNQALASATALNTRARSRSGSRRSIRRRGW